MVVVSPGANDPVEGAVVELEVVELGLMGVGFLGVGVVVEGPVNGVVDGAVDPEPGEGAVVVVSGCGSGTVGAFVGERSVPPPPKMSPIDVPPERPPPGTSDDIGPRATSSMTVRAAIARTNAPNAANATWRHLRFRSPSRMVATPRPSMVSSDVKPREERGLRLRLRSLGPGKGLTRLVTQWKEYEYSAAPTVATMLTTAAPTTVPATPKKEAMTEPERAARAPATTWITLMCGPRLSAADEPVV